MADANVQANNDLAIPLVFGPDELAPPVDRPRLVDFVAGDLPEEEIEETCQLIATFRPWYEAWRDILWSQARSRA